MALEAMTGLLAQLAEQNAHFTSLFTGKHNLIHEMAWEKDLAATLSLSLGQMRFALAFFVAVAVGAGIRPLRSPTRESPQTGAFVVMRPLVGLGKWLEGRRGGRRLCSSRHRCDSSGCTKWHARATARAWHARARAWATWNYNKPRHAHIA